MSWRRATRKCCAANSTWLTLFAVMAAGTWWTTASRALMINISYDAARSQPPSFDPTGRQLGEIVTAAAGIWEDIIEDNWTINLAYTWGDLGNNGTRGAAIVLDTRAGRPTSARLRIDTGNAGREHDWYLDPTPLDHDEYDLPQILYRDLSVSQQADWYNGSPPDLLEVSYAGLAKDSAPSVVRNGYDLLSIVMHEIGHTIGVSDTVAGRETFDLDYDVLPALVGGANVAIVAAGRADHAHLAAARTLMFPAVVEGIRRLPSQTDVFAAASGAGWTSIDLPRQDFLNGSSWNRPGNWIGNSVPDEDDDAFVRHGGSLSLDGPATVRNLAVAESSFVRTGGSPLTVRDTATIDGAGSAPSAQLELQSNGQLRAAVLEIIRGGALQLRGGAADIESRAFVDQSSRIAGFGEINLGGFTNNGTLAATGGTLSIRVDALTDLDGSLNTGVLEATSGSLHFVDNEGGVIPYRGHIRIGAGHELRLDQFGLRIDRGDSPSGLDFSGGSYVAPRLIQNGRISVNSAAATIASTTEFLSGSSTTLGADLHLAGTAIVHPGASMTGTGDLVVTPGSRIDFQNNAALGVNVVNRGRVELASPGVSSVDGYRQTESATLAVKVHGTPAGVQHDRLRVSGTAELAGILEVELIDGYRPAEGTVENFAVLSAGGRIVGTFDDQPSGHQGGGLFLETIYHPKDVQLTLLQAAPGDANGDQRFDQSDIIQVSIAGKYLSDQRADWTEGDWNGGPGGGDGVFNQLDLLAALRAGFYRTAPELSIAPLATDGDLSVVGPWGGGRSRNDVNLTNVPVPEPSTFLLLGAAMASLLIHVRGVAKREQSSSESRL